MSPNKFKNKKEITKEQAKGTELIHGSIGLLIKDESMIQLFTCKCWKGSFLTQRFFSQP